MYSSPLETHILIYNMLKTPKLTRKTKFQLVARRSECSDPWIDIKNGFYGPKNPYFDVSYVNKRQFYDFFDKKPTVVAWKKTNNIELKLRDFS